MSINKVTLLGNVGQDPKIYSNENFKVANISVATSERWKDKATGELKSKTEWHYVTFYKYLADTVEKYVHKGSKIYVEGKLQTREWEGKDGKKNKTTEIVASVLELLDARKEDNRQAVVPVASAQDESEPF